MPVHVRPERLLWVKLRNTRREQMFSGLPRVTDIVRLVRLVRFVPEPEVGTCILARRHAWSFRHPGHPVRVHISLNVLRSPKAQPVHNNRDALGGVDLSRDRPSLSGFFNPSRHRMACHQGAMSPYIIRVLLHSNFRPQGTILVSTSQEMRNCHSILGHKNTRIEGAQPQTNLELFYRGVFVTEPKLNIPGPNSCNSQIWIKAYSPRQ